MSILPLEFQNGDTCASLNLTGKEIYSIEYNIYDNEKLAIVKVKILEKEFSMIFLFFSYSSLIMVKHFQ
jgi:aconitase A